MRLDIACYACHHGITAASLHFTKKLSVRVRESTVQCIKKAYLDEIKKMRASSSDEVLESLPWKKQGRPLLLGDKIDGMVQSYIRRIREDGAGVSTQIVLGAARGILKIVDKQKLREFGGHIDISRQWALLFCAA